MHPPRTTNNPLCTSHHNAMHASSTHSHQNPHPFSKIIPSTLNNPNPKCSSLSSQTTTMCQPSCTHSLATSSLYHYRASSDPLFLFTLLRNRQVRPVTLPCIVCNAIKMYWTFEGATEGQDSRHHHYL